MLTQDEAPSGGGRRPLIGREVDVQAVTASVRRGFDHGSALLITGEAGVGKTALLDRVVSDMTDGTLGCLWTPLQVSGWCVLPASSSRPTSATPR